MKGKREAPRTSASLVGQPRYPGAMTHSHIFPAFEAVPIKVLTPSSVMVRQRLWLGWLSGFQDWPILKGTYRVRGGVLQRPPKNTWYPVGGSWIPGCRETRDVPKDRVKNGSTASFCQGRRTEAVLLPFFRPPSGSPVPRWGLRLFKVERAFCGMWWTH